MVMSLTQGGSGFPFLAECIFDYICGVDIKDVKVTIDTVPDYDVYSSLRKVSLASFLLHCVTWECSSCIFKLVMRQLSFNWFFTCWQLSISIIHKVN